MLVSKESLAKQSFLVTTRDKRMLGMCIWLFYVYSWAIDSKFKTRHFGLPLCVRVVPNNKGVGIPLWYMLHSYDCGSNHAQLVLDMTLRIIFKYGEYESKCYYNG